MCTIQNAKCIPARLRNPSLQHSPALYCHANHDVQKRLLLILVCHSNAGTSQMDEQSKHVITHTTDITNINICIIHAQTCEED